MPFVTYTDFKGEINIPNTDKTEVLEELNEFIVTYEDKFLREVFGYGLYKSYKAGLLVNPIDAKWTDIRDGKEYTLNTTGRQWLGIKKPTANYIYYWYMRNKATDTTGVGEVVSKTDNSTRVSPGRKMVSAWNEMVEQVWQLVQFIDTSIASYPEWSWYLDGYVNTHYWKMYNYNRLKDVFYEINTFNI